MTAQETFSTIMVMNIITHDLSVHTILITGGARRLGRAMALSAAKAGADIVLHHAHSPIEANQTAEEIHALGRQAWIVEANLLDNVEKIGRASCRERV